MRHRFMNAFSVAAVLALCASATASAQCSPFLCWVDLANGGSFICPNPNVYNVQVGPIAIGADNPTCNPATIAALVKVSLPAGCTGLNVWVQYEGDPDGWTLNVGDSVSNDGFGGDSGSSPEGQNAELQILDERLGVYSAATEPSGVDTLVTQQLALKDGGFNVVVGNQALSWGNPYSAMASEDIQDLFFLGANPDNLDVYVGLNRVVSGTFRSGCGLRRALLTTR